MKLALKLSILAIVCFGNGDAAFNAGSAAISRLKTTTQTTTNDLMRYVNKLSRDLSMKLHNLQTDQMRNINDIANPAMNDVQAMIANAKDKNAEHCLEPARMRLREASMNGFKELDKCTVDGKSKISPVNANIDAAISLGNGIVNELDAIAINCYSSNSMQMQNCIIGKIPNASSTVKVFQDTANELKRTGDATLMSAVNAAFSCYLKPPQKVRQEATSVRIDTKKCVDNA